MADTLEDFLTKTRRDLAPLPLEEQERRLDSVSVQLAQYMAVHLEKGLDDEAAAQEAIRQFEALHGSALHFDLPLRTQIGPSLSPVTVSALYGIVSSTAISCFLGFVLSYLIAPLLPSLSSDFGDVLIPKLTPSFLIAILAGVVLCFREGGVSGICMTLMSPQTLAGVGARWSLLKQSLLTLLTVILLLVLRSAAASGLYGLPSMQQSPELLVLGLAILLLMPAVPFLAGWIIARAFPQAGVRGVSIAAITGGLLSFVDQYWGQFNSPGYSSPGFQITVFAFLLLGQTLLAGLAIAGARIGSQDAKTRS